MSLLKAAAVEGSAGNGGLVPVRISKLIIAVFWVLQAQCTRDVELDRAQQQLADALGFKNSLLTWSPLRDGSGPQLAHAQELLLRLWGCFGAGCGCSLALQQLYAWSVLASSLASILPIAQELVPLRNELRSGMTNLKGLEGKALLIEELCGMSWGPRVSFHSQL